MTKILPTISAQVAPISVAQLKPKANAAAFNKKVQPEKFEFKIWMKRSFKEFATNTALHGYNHIVREDTAMWER